MIWGNNSKLELWDTDFQIETVCIAILDILYGVGALPPGDGVHVFVGVVGDPADEGVLRACRRVRPHHAILYTARKRIR